MKRFVCFLLAMILIMGMVPATAVTASAASERTTSDKAIGIIKGSVTFYSKEEAGKIGYSTNASYVPTKSSIPNNFLNYISKEHADALLREFLKEKVDKAINKFAKDYNLDLTQQEHDALAVYAYRTGALNPATDTTPFVTARIVKTVGTNADKNAMINAFVQVHGVKASNDEYLKAGLNVALAEAAMYLYGDYGYNGNNRFAYSVLDKNNNLIADSADEVVAYIKSEGYNLDPLNSTTFLGWYLYDSAKKVITGSPLTKLTNDHNGKLIVAKSAAANSEVAVVYDLTITSSLADLNLYNFSGTTATRTDKTLSVGSTFKVEKEKIDSTGVKWVLGNGTNTAGQAARGWVKIGKLEGATPDINKPIATAKITAAVVNVYPGATSDGAAAVDTLKKDQVVNIYETKVEMTNYGNKVWGKITYKDGSGNAYFGWINLANATVTETKGESGSAEGQTGVIANDSEVNIRENAGVGYNKLTALKAGTKVTVLEMNAERTWAKIKWDTPSNGYTQGWVYMHYVKLDSAAQGSNGAGVDTVLYTGIVTSNINLNVRQYADIYAPRVNSLPYGTKVNVYELADARNMKWGRIGENQWVCTSYLNMTKVETTTGSNGSGTASGNTSTQGTVTTAALNVLKNYNNNAEKVGELAKGDVVTILERNTETTETGSRIWGRIEKGNIKGWINLAYVDLKTVTTVTSGSSSSTTNNTPIPAIISDCLSVNVRSAAGVYSTALTKLNNGTAVTVVEQITHDNAPWARIKYNNGANEGWVCMYYVTLNAGTGSTATNNDGILNGTNNHTISATGYVNNAYLNVRGGAGLNFAQIGTLNQGAKVTVFEQAVSDGLIWGRINYNNTTGWVCMTYITVESASTTGKGVMGTVARCYAKANVRSAPGTNNALVSTVNVGSRVEVFEIKTHANQKWGRIPQGWICMEYVLLDSELPEGTVLDATTAPTTATTVPATTVNKDNEVKYVINGTVSTTSGSALIVRNDTNDKSDRIGTINNNLSIQILAVKNNGAELWGRVDQYATAGWVNLKDVQYSVAGYINTDNQPVYADASTSSTVKGKLPINTAVTIQKLTVNGETVYGWYQDLGSGLSGWVPMGRISKNTTDVLPTYQSSTDKFNNGTDIVGKTNSSITAYAATNNSEAVFYLNSGVTVYIGEINLEAGIVWGKIIANGKTGWINLGAVTYQIPATATIQNLKAYKTTVASDDYLLGKVNVPGAPLPSADIEIKVGESKTITVPMDTYMRIKDITPASAASFTTTYDPMAPVGTNFTITGVAPSEGVVDVTVTYNYLPYSMVPDQTKTYTVRVDSSEAIITTSSANLKICELSFDSNGALWGKLTGYDANSQEAALNGGFVKMTSVSTGALSIATK